MREFLLGIRDGFRKGKAAPWSVVVAGYFAPFTGLVRTVSHGFVKPPMKLSAGTMRKRQRGTRPKGTENEGYSDFSVSSGIRSGHRHGAV
jgi:hypothetical protein